MAQERQQNGLAAALRAARRERGLLQADVAERAGLTRFTIVDLEAGKGSLRSLFRALAALELEVVGRNLPAGERLGARLRALRRRRGMSGRDLAELVGMAPNTVVSLERHERGRVETLDRVFRALGAGVYLAKAGSRRAFFNHVGQSSVHHGWATPSELLNRLYAVFGRFDLDPCSPSKRERDAPVRARVHFTMADDGLNLPWHGRVFVNPPYGRELERWIAKAKAEVEQGRARCVVALVPSRTDTRWWHEHIAGVADVYLLRGRLAFGDGEVPAPFPSAVVVWGADSAAVQAMREQLDGAWHVPRGS